MVPQTSYFNFPNNYSCRKSDFSKLYARKSTSSKNCWIVYRELSPVPQ